MTDFVEAPEFLKDIKRLHKKYNSICEDLKNFRERLEPILPEHLSGTVRISGLGERVKTPIYKVKHFRCKSLKGKGCRSGIRVIYAYEKDKITLIEIYHKSEKQNEDKERILRYFS